MERKSDKKIKSLVITAILAAMVFALSAIRINMPSPDFKAAIHFGNIMCILSGLLFGAMKGGLSAGIGSMFYDFTNPLYIKDAPITFINKFMMGFVAGLVFKILKIKSQTIRVIISAIIGQLTYIVLYLGKTFVTEYFLYKNAFETAVINLGVKAVSSLTNAAIAVIFAVVLYFPIRNILRKTPFKDLIR